MIVHSAALFSMRRAARQAPAGVRLGPRLQHALDEGLRAAPPTTTHEPGKEPAGEGAPAAAPSVTKTPARSVPVYKKWWFWTAIGAVVLVGVAVGVGVGVGTASSG